MLGWSTTQRGRAAGKFSEVSTRSSRLRVGVFILHYVPCCCYIVDFVHSCLRADREFFIASRPGRPSHRFGCGELRRKPHRPGRVAESRTRHTDRRRVDSRRGACRYHPSNGRSPLGKPWTQEEKTLSFFWNSLPSPHPKSIKLFPKFWNFCASQSDTLTFVNILGMLVKIL